MDLHSELVRLATRLIVEESSESETTDTLGREFTRAAQSRQATARRGLPDPIPIVSDGGPGLSARSTNAVRARCVSAIPPISAKGPKISGQSSVRAIACNEVAWAGAYARCGRTSR
jgi:hypothetical protein